MGWGVDISKQQREWREALRQHEEGETTERENLEKILTPKQIDVFFGLFSLDLDALKESLPDLTIAAWNEAREALAWSDSFHEFTWEWWTRLGDHLKPLYAEARDLGADTFVGAQAYLKKTAPGALGMLQRHRFRQLERIYNFIYELGFYSLLDSKNLPAVCWEVEDTEKILRSDGFMREVVEGRAVRFIARFSNGTIAVVHTSVRSFPDQDPNLRLLLHQPLCYFTHLGETIEIEGGAYKILKDAQEAVGRISDRLVILARFLENLYESAPDSSKGHHKVKPAKPCSRPDYTPHTGSARTPLTFDQEKLKNIFGNLSAAQTAAKLKKIAEKGMDNKTEALKIAKDLQAKIDEVWGKATEPERKALLEAAKAWGQVLAELGESFAFTQPKDAPKPALAPEDKVARPSASKPIPAPEDGVKLAPKLTRAEIGEVNEFVRRLEEDSAQGLATPPSTPDDLKALAAAFRSAQHHQSWHGSTDPQQEEATRKLAHLTKIAKAYFFARKPLHQHESPYDFMSNAAWNKDLKNKHILASLWFAGVGVVQGPQSEVSQKIAKALDLGSFDKITSKWPWNFAAHGHWPLLLDAPVHPGKPYIISAQDAQVLTSAANNPAPPKPAPVAPKPAPKVAPPVSLEDEFAALGDLVGGKAGELAKEAAAMLRAATAAKEAAAMLRGAGLGDLADEFSELAGMLK